MRRLSHHFGGSDALRPNKRQIGVFAPFLYLILAFYIGFLFGIVQLSSIYEPMIYEVSGSNLLKSTHKTANLSKPTQAVVKPKQKAISQIGKASWYDYNLKGIEWSKSHRTCASRFFKRYSTVIVRNKANGKEVECYVNDYIEHPDRIIDLSSFAFQQLDDLKIGLLDVEVILKENAQ